jgi:hypothetical protein
MKRRESGRRDNNEDSQRDKKLAMWSELQTAFTTSLLCT